MNIIDKLADLNNPDSLAMQMRRRRFGLFMRIIESIPGRARVVDLGGTPQFWLSMPDADVEVVLVNLPGVFPSRLPHNCSAVFGDATDSAYFPDYSFDVVFSNSVIEHVGDWSAQQRMAAEIRRLAPRYFVQTPNFYFPIEPHYHALGVHWLPAPLKRFWLRASGRAYDDAELYRIRLLSKRQLGTLFPDAQIWTEDIGWLTKSFVVWR